MRHVLPLVMIPVLSLALAAQEAGRIQGKITDKAGNPVADATITLVRTGTNVTKGTKSLKDGAYFLTGVAASEQEISYSAQGFVPPAGARSHSRGRRADQGHHPIDARTGPGRGGQD